MQDIGFSKTDLGPAKNKTMDTFVRELTRSFFMNDSISSILQVRLEGTDQKEAPIVELEIRLRSINGNEIKLEDVDDGS